MHKVANKLRELVGPLPEIYTNEDDNIDAWDVVPKGLSMLSYDDYDNHNNNGSVELSRQWEYTHDVMLSRMWPHQRLMLVPGVVRAIIIYSLLCASFDRLANHKLCATSLVMTRVTASSTTTSRALSINSRTRS